MSNTAVFAYEGTVRSPSTFLTAMFTDQTAASAGDTPSSLSSVNAAIDFTSVDQDVDLAICDGTACASPAECRTLMSNANNWTTEDETGGGDCCDADGVDWPEDSPTSLTVPVELMHFSID